MKNWRHVCIFVSSTFKDMDTERDALRNLVEPKLNHYLEKYMISVEFIDLRHCVKTDKRFTETEREKQICSVCLEEIDKCFPYFIGLLGHRYGWIPPKGVIENDSINMLPVEESELSVTLHEFNRGLLSKSSDARGCIFVRKGSSYKNLNINDLEDYVDRGKEKNIDSIRNYIINNDKISTIEYDIDLGNITASSISEWVDMAYNAIIDLLTPEYDNIDRDDELFAFYSSQERYVQSKLKNFRGREVELKEFSCKMKKRNGCIIAEKEYGMGMHSFICAAYDSYRQNTDNICLFYSSQASLGNLKFEEVLYYWLKSLNKNYINEDVSFDRISGNIDLLVEKFKKYIELLKQRGKEIYVFMCKEGKSMPNSFMSLDIILCTLCLYDDKIMAYRPLMYMLGPLKKGTIAQIVESLRPQVRSKLLRHPKSSFARWLAMAIMQLDRLDKMDFLTIRNNLNIDSEQSIVKYQLEMIDEFDYNADEMLSKWHSKIRKYMGARLVDKIIYCLGIAELGIPASLCCSIVGCSLTEFTLVCYALGDDIVCENASGLWSLKNSSVLYVALEEILANDRNDVLSAMKSYIETNPYISNSALRIYILSGDVEDVVKMLEPFINFNEIRKTTFIDDIIWLGSFMPEELKNFFVKMTKTPNSLSYKFLFYIINCIKNLGDEPTKRVFAEIIFILKKWLTELWEKHKIDAKIHSILGDIISCVVDFYHEQGDYRALNEELRYGLEYSESLLDKYPLWTEPYLYFIYKMVNLYDHGTNFNLLKTTIVPLENKNTIKIPKDNDATLYAICLVETYKYFVAYGEHNVMHFASKAIDIFMDMFDRHSSINTVLGPNDLLRNLLYYVHIILTIDENSPKKVLDKDWVQEKGWKIIRKCMCYKKFFKDDVALYYYYDLIGKLLKHSQDNINDRIYTLYKYVYELIEIDSSLNYLAFTVLSRSSSEVSISFAAYFNLMSVVFHLLSQVEGNAIPSTEWLINKNSTMAPGITIKKKTHLSFEDELEGIKPIIGAKDMNSDHSYLLNDSFILLYESMINVQLKERFTDIVMVKSLYNSLCTLIRNSEFSDLLPHRLKVVNRRLLDEILEGCSQEFSLYNDFSDCFGIDGDSFIKMWENGDPELDYGIQIYDNPDQFTWSRRELEQRVQNSDYKSIIEEFGSKEELSLYEAYYLGLAFMRTGTYDCAFNVINNLFFQDLPETLMTNGVRFSILTNYLIACILSHHFEEYEEVYETLEQEDREDEDIVKIHKAYQIFVKDGELNIPLDKPYGYII